MGHLRDRFITRHKFAFLSRQLCAISGGIAAMRAFISFPWNTMAKTTTRPKLAGRRSCADRKQFGKGSIAKMNETQVNENLQVISTARWGWIWRWAWAGCRVVGW